MAPKVQIERKISLATNAHFALLAGQQAINGLLRSKLMHFRYSGAQAVHHRLVVNHRWVAGDAGQSLRRLPFIDEHTMPRQCLCVGGG